MSGKNESYGNGTGSKPSGAASSASGTVSASSGSTSSTDKTMKAPGGGDARISRESFEKNPAAYFRDQRNK